MTYHPLIGITSPRTAMDSPFGVVDFSIVTMAYSDAVARAGGRPAILPVVHPAAEHDLLEGFDGLLLTGGGDISPHLYGEEADDAVYGTSEARDHHEIGLLAEAERRGIPVFGICRGLQVLNVSRGGTLIQDVGDESHWQKVTPSESAHAVDIEPDSRLASIASGASLDVNSYHHQAAGTIGSGLRVAARSGDIVEALESEDQRVLAVQWHPEHMFSTSEDHLTLFADLVERARVYHRNTK